MSDEKPGGQGQIMPLYRGKGILEVEDGWWACYRKHNGELVPVDIKPTKAEAEDWLGYRLPVTDLTPKPEPALHPVPPADE